MGKPFLLINVNNTNTSFALADTRRLVRVVRIPTVAARTVPFARTEFDGALLASVVPAVSRRLISRLPQRPIEVSAALDLGIGIRYPRPRQIGADRLANAVGVVRLYGAPAIVVDFGTALTFDIVNARGEYIGGVIAPGLAAVTEYLYQRTALLPRIRLRAPRSVIGRSTVEAMRVGAVVGYRGLVKEILTELKKQPELRRATVVATGGYGHLIARHVPAIQRVDPRLTLEGLRFIYLHQLNESH
ncbi:MAG: type III pantothenate kinase [Verrucomicrobiae bacterium]|nr:type III pantothenate kinase [Verrucomicrobiae bacterium]MDW8343106.1 type III pantothenate kinase [Verrucomicrobiae bacterium]